MLLRIIWTINIMLAISIVSLITMIAARVLFN